MAAEQKLGVRVIRQWWDQAGLNFGQEARRVEERMGCLKEEGGRENDVYVV